MPAMSAPAPNPLPEPTRAAAPDAAARISRNLALASLLALVALCLAWELWLAPTGRGTLAVKALPLMLGVAGLLKYKLFTFRWLSLAVWLYVIEGSVRAYGDGGLSARLAMAELALCALLFAACGWHVRARLARGRALATAAATDTPAP